MNLRQLRYFAAAVEQRSVTRAAETLHIAQPALGQHIRALEEELDVLLLTRHSRGVTPTTAGEQLYARSREILQLIEQTKREVMAIGKAVPQTMTLGLTPSLTLLFGTDLQLAYGEHAPGDHLRLWEEPSFRLATAVANGELDVALAYDIAPRAGLALMPVMEEEMVFVSRPNLAPDRNAVDLAYILECDLALGTAQDIGRRVLASAAGRSPEDLPIQYELQSMAGIRNMVLRGKAVSVLPYGSVAHEVRTGQLTAMRITGAPLKSTLYVVTRTAKDGCWPYSEPLFSWLVEKAVSMAAERQPALATRLGMAISFLQPG